MKPYTSYQEGLIEALKNSELAAEYLTALLEEGDRQLFLSGLRDVLEAQGGMTFISRKTKLNRVSLYKMLSKKGNPEFNSILLLLRALGIKFQIAPKSHPKSHRKAA